MKVLNGRGASDGIVMGRLKIIRHRVHDKTENGKSSDPEVEMNRLDCALIATGEEFDRLYENALSKVGESEAAIFEIHKMMLEDEDFTGEVRRLIVEELVSADVAVTRAGSALADKFRQMDSEYMRARAADIIAVSERLAECIRGESHSAGIDSPVIIASDDLTPAETIEFDRDMVLGFVTEGGSDMSHTAILSRMMGIPAVVSVGCLSDEYDGCEVMLDGTNGVLYIEPTYETAKIYRENLKRKHEEAQRLELMRGLRCVNRYGERVYVSANAGELGDVDLAVENDAEGVGLFRSEFIFMRRSSPPTEDEQYQIYLEAAKKLRGDECVVRTLDVGADKRISYLTGNTREANPAMGIRAVRLCLRMPELLMAQFRALYRAAAVANISAMIPMICLPSEVERVREISREAKESLEREGARVGDMKIGIMIETPSAAILSDILAPMVDFFSIGTNDLIQYTLAADRENPDVAYLTDPLPESVRRCIRMACTAARREGIPVCVCGELGARTEETEFLIELGVTKLSVAPTHILRVREKVYESLQLFHQN
ncbi:MAG: phosphoenolpyruvate--protein phosphotransferase [Clostridia bacterium]|nr:phosphoenolpyruvate--protein phosphotransferase [Clostridia bacterium]